MRWIFVPLLYLLPLIATGTGFGWSSKDYSDQASKSTCIPVQEYKSVTLKRHSRAANFTQLGKVAGIEVCGLLCCEVESCDLALLEDEHCYAVDCLDLESCEFGPSSGKSEVLTFRRKSGTDIWTSGQQNAKNSETGYQENKAKIVTKQAAVQKSSIPEITNIASEQKGSFIAFSSNKVASPMDALLQKEASMVRNKQKEREKNLKDENKEEKNKISQQNMGQKIQDITEHYLKAEEKSDMTALQENETTIVHTKIVPHRRDLRHTLISPITIGAFTCMAVIAVSGFAMAIIKYQRERKEFEDKQTQKP